MKEQEYTNNHPKRYAIRLWLTAQNREFGICDVREEYEAGIYIKVNKTTYLQWNTIKKNDATEVNDRYKYLGLK